MVNAAWNDISRMDISAVKDMVTQLKEKADISIEERIQLTFGLFRLEFFDNALFQIQTIYAITKNDILTAKIVEKIPKLKTILYSSYEIVENCFGDLELVEVNDDFPCCCCTIGGMLLVSLGSKICPWIFGCSCFTGNDNSLCERCCNICCCCCRPDFWGH